MAAIITEYNLTLVPMAKYCKWHLRNYWAAGTKIVDDHWKVLQNVYFFMTIKKLKPSYHCIVL